MISTLDLINSLPVPSDSETLCVEVISKDDFYVTKNSSGISGILIRLTSNDNNRFLTYSSESLEILARDDCKIETKNRVDTISALIIQPKISVHGSGNKFFC